MRHFLVAAIACTFLAVGSTDAVADIIITNHSFEADGLTDGQFTGGATGWGSTPGAGTGIGHLNPVEAQFSGTSGSGSIPGGDGERVGYISVAGEMWQNIGMIDANTQYDLTVAIGERKDLGWGHDLTVSLRATSRTGTLLGSGVYTAADAPNGSFTDVGFSIDSSNFGAEVGNSLFVVFSSTGGQELFDNLRVTAATVPEPTSFALLAPCGICFAGRRRRRQTVA